MARVLVLESHPAVADLLADHLRASQVVSSVRLAPFTRDRRGRTLPVADWPTLLRQEGSDVVVFSPWAMEKQSAAPDLETVEAVFRTLAAAPVRRFVVLSSAAVYGPNPHNPGLMSESPVTHRQRQNPLAARWLALEELAHRYLQSSAETTLTILRPAAVSLGGGLDPLSSLLHRRLAIIVAGHDPSIQLLSKDDLVRAIGCAVESGAVGTFNVAPDAVIPLRQALRLAGVRALPVPFLLHRLVRAVTARLGLSAPAAQVDYLRYNWTISGARINTAVGFVPRSSSAAALVDAVPPSGRTAGSREEVRQRRFDDFGLDEKYCAACERGLVGFLQRRWWRLEVRDAAHVPHEGRAVLVGVHRGFMPWDGILTIHVVCQQIGRVPRFLMHPGLVKFPYLHDFLFKHGAIIACQANADHILQRGDLLGVYPEGIHGAFRLYRDAYRIDAFGRQDYVRMALRNRAPIVPFVTLGSAETFPILAKIEWAWWKRYAEWPFIPITPTFPLLPVPLPSKWHMRFLAPLHIERDYPPEAAADDRVVNAIGEEVRRRIEESLTEMLQRRRSIFFGSIFRDEPVGEAEHAAGANNVRVGETG